MTTPSEDSSPLAHGPGPVRAPDPALVGGTVPEPDEDATASDLEADIERTRRELGDTVGALSEKLNPKLQAEHQVDDLKARVREQAEHMRRSAQTSVDHARGAVIDPDGHPSPAGWIGAGAVIGAALGLLVAAVGRAR